MLIPLSSFDKRSAKGHIKFRLKVKELLRGKANENSSKELLVVFGFESLYSKVLGCVDFRSTFEVIILFSKLAILLHGVVEFLEISKNLVDRIGDYVLLGYYWWS
jgi:hypothetical protein